MSPPTPTAGGYASEFAPIVARPEHAVFRRDRPEYSVFYAPGSLCLVPRAQARDFESAIGPGGEGWAGRLWERAEQARARQIGAWPFEPECLMVYLNNECNLRCAYCHSAPGPERRLRLSHTELVAAARLVAGGCRQRGRTFYVVFHGGGEPALDPALLEASLAHVDAVAADCGVQAFRYVATNGTMAEETARRLAPRFQMMGLSCDGPPDIQDAQRPRWAGGETSAAVERTARAVKDAGTRLSVRTTITRRSVDRQAEVAAYACRDLGADELDLEPAYATRRLEEDPVLALSGADAPAYVAGYLAARRVAREAGTRLHSSIGNFDWAHGPYCHFLRQVLCVTPGGLATACFRNSDPDALGARGLGIGSASTPDGGFTVDHDRVEQIRRRVLRLPASCRTCFCRHHCSRGCPDFCLADDGDLADPSGGFRCQAQRRLSTALLDELAERLWGGSGVSGQAPCEPRGADLEPGTLA